MAVYMNGNEIGNFSMTRIVEGESSNVFVINATIPSGILTGLNSEIVAADKTISQVREAIEKGSLIFVRLTGNYYFEGAVLNLAQILDDMGYLSVLCDTIIEANRVRVYLNFSDYDESSISGSTITVTNVL